MRRGILAGLTALLVAVVSVVAGTAATLRRSAAPGAPTTAATPACNPPPAGSRRLGSIDGRIPVVVHTPPRARAGAPLVLALPGSGQTARDFAAYTGYSRLADLKGFSVAYPTASGRQPAWNISGTAVRKPDDVAYLRKVIAAVLRVTCADPGRVGVTGVSNGGGMSARLACDAADLIVAAAPVAGGYGSLPDCHPSRPVPILEIHGTGDRVVPYNGRGAGGYGAVARFLAQWRRLDGCPAAATQRAPRRGVAELRWAPCRGATAVIHLRIYDADHGWPGEDDVIGSDEFSATDRTWAFLSSYGT